MTEDASQLCAKGTHSVQRHTTGVQCTVSSTCKSKTSLDGSTKLQIWLGHLVVTDRASKVPTCCVDTRMTKMWEALVKHRSYVLTYVEATILVEGYDIRPM